MKSKNLRAFSLIELSIVILIVGIIIAGVTQSSSLVAKFKINSARNLSQNSEVNSIRDLLIWVDATREGALVNSNNSTNIQNGDLIKQWNDINPHSFNKNNLTQSTTASFPTYVENGINGIASIGFDGTDDWLNIPYLLGNLANQSFTVIVVGQSRQSSSANNTFFISTQQPQRLYIHQNITTGVVNAIIGTSSLTLTSSLSAAQPFIASLSHNATTDLNTFKVSNASDLTGTGSYSGTPTSMTMGGFNQGSVAHLTQSCNCLISEFMLYDRILTTDERSAIFSYLSKKWGIRI